ncbi:MAG: Fpg/Nei family DNA glycosylase [Acidimicrobiales bacterium]
MPEGHTIHRLARDLRRDLAGRPVSATSPQGRFADGAATFDGSTLATTDAVGKHLFLRFDRRSGSPSSAASDPESLLHVHLGLFGKLRRARTGALPPRDAIRLRLEGAAWSWDLSGPTACELIDEDGFDRLRDRLGPDPLRADADPKRFVARVTGSTRAIGALLLDQAVVAGIGNVYRSELCFRHGIDPRVPGRDLDPDLLLDLWDDAVALLTIGVRLGRIVTVDPADACVEPARTSAARLTRDQRLYVYRRQSCLRCGAPVQWFDLANRRAYACPVEQPR